MSMNAPKKYVKPRITCGPGRTKQSFKQECDINSIIARYQKTGMMDHVKLNPGVFADVSNVGDYAGMVRKVRHAQESFELLPGALRQRFHQDPGEFVSFISDPENRSEAVKLGLVPAPAPVVEPPSDKKVAAVKAAEKEAKSSAKKA